MKGGHTIIIIVNLLISQTPALFYRPLKRGVVYPPIGKRRGLSAHSEWVESVPPTKPRGKWLKVNKSKWVPTPFILLLDPSDLYWFSDNHVTPDTPQDQYYYTHHCSENTPIIVENGSWQCRAGWGSRDQPQFTFRSVMARMRGKRVKCAHVTLYDCFSGCSQWFHVIGWDWFHTGR